MVILIAVGVMNIAAMIGLAAVVLIEKTRRWGTAAGQAAGVAPLAWRWPWSGLPGWHRACTPRRR
jgi:predicted metal-binding membrane protein